MDTNNEGYLLNSSPLSVNYDNGEIRNVNNCLKALMWLHGVVTWPLSTGTTSAMFDDHDKKRWKERLTFISSLISLVVLTFTSTVALILYLYCYFGRIDHFLRFVSHQCYWPSLMSAQIICLAALIKNQVGKRRNISWVKVFSVKCCARIMSSFTSKTGTIPLPKCSAFLILYLLVPTVHSALKLTFFITLETECQNFPEYLWLISEISVAYFFSMFCYFLYLNRINLERESEIASKFIQQHVGEFDECISTVTTFFREYYQLRKILVPWLNFVIFNSTFGLTVFFTWNFNEIVLPSSTTSVPITDSYVTSHHSERGMCSYTCDREQFLHEDNTFVLYNLVVLWRNVMIAILPYYAANALDIKYVWTDFKMEVKFMYSGGERKFWKDLTNYMDTLHPNTTTDTIGCFIFPFSGFASAFLSGKQQNF
ncbi:uncharacterized protein [Apostichopus japonicus]|uniref:uncharacterized protein n=1 Tax=Stichopus japonicus TaxID=307972 RepID=UPI003AB4938E